jgi:hypothetical protein
MSGIASRIAEMLDPEMKPVRKPASSIRRAPMPSPQPGMICSRGSSKSARATASLCPLFFDKNVITLRKTGCASAASIGEWVRQ